jgi:hypothetical protein
MSENSTLEDLPWLELFAAAFTEDSALAEQAARLWHYLVTEIERGPEGATNARHHLERAIRLTFPFTRRTRNAETALKPL